MPKVTVKLVKIRNFIGFFGIFRPKSLHKASNLYISLKYKFQNINIFQHFIYPINVIPVDVFSSVHQLTNQAESSNVKCSDAVRLRHLVYGGLHLLVLSVLHLLNFSGFDSSGDLPAHSPETLANIRCYLFHVLSCEVPGKRRNDCFTSC